ncbi:MAG TPA: 30S ribosomal protein S17 [Firmicutes bacterium]|nr:30S ribosomal protein S17 [Bacillota bacterium]
MEVKSSRRRQLEGVVFSDKMEKSVTVGIVRKVKHPVYKKYIKRTTKVMAHDEKNEAKKGDTVSIKEVRPMSKKKRWVVTAVVKRALEDIALKDNTETESGE